MRMNSEDQIEISRKGHIAEEVLIVDGQPGCGKTMFSSLLGSFDRVEKMEYAFEMEFACRLALLAKIEKDAAIALIRLLSDFTLYQNMMGRGTNFRFSDISSVFNHSSPGKYIRRAFQEGDSAVLERVKSEKPILNLTTHYLSVSIDLLVEALGKRLVFVEIVRHPLYMLVQQELNHHRLTDNVRNIEICFNHNKSDLPWYANGWADEFQDASDIDRAIFLMKRISNISRARYNDLSDSISSKWIRIPFEQFVLDPAPSMRLLENTLATRSTYKTKKELKKQKVPRKMIADGRRLEIYRYCGWTPPEKGATEQAILRKKWQYAVDKGASTNALCTLEEMCVEYEAEYPFIKTNETKTNYMLDY